MCGETAELLDGAVPNNGSSPRVWGNLVSVPSVPTVPRFIPTCVGKLPALEPQRQSRTVHPHVCGETFILSPQDDRVKRFIPTCVGKLIFQPPSHLCLDGSSPRVWGNCVGFYWESGDKSVHPHVCGETVFARGEECRPMRFIPTCVGKLISRVQNPGYIAVHPHVCGETLLCGANPGIPSGSSPRVWGNCLIYRTRRQPGGSSPRVWGNFCSNKFVIAKAPVHPHVCGETLLWSYCPRPILRFIPTCVGKLLGKGNLVEFDGGSSPRVWGNCNVRITEARVHPVHPHVCGETDERQCPGLVAVRFIPTCVGKLCSPCSRKM